MDAVIPQTAEIDRFLAASLGEHSADWPRDWSGTEAATRALDGIAYHGIAGLLAAHGERLEQWPALIRDSIREAALARSMWELRHKIVLAQLLDQLSASGVPNLLLKGTAVAYDLYDNPASRARGDTDLLVAEPDRQVAIALLGRSGFTRDRPDLPEGLRSQEGWSLTSDDGTCHSIDLHWQPLNAPALDRQLTFAELFEGSRPLPRVCDAARAPARPMMLLHACLHRGLHDCAPYFVGGEAYFGGNRLIWLYDIALLGRAMSETEWRSFCRTAVDKRVSDVCLDGLLAAETRLGAFCPSFVREELGRAESGPYFRSGQFGRALLDMLAIRGAGRKLQYVRARSLPTAEFMRGKYPDMATSPLPALYVRRLVELFRERPGRPV